MTFYIKQGNTSPSLVATLKDAAGVAVDLTGASVRFHLRDANRQTLVDAAGTVVTAASGIVRYDWQAGDTAVSGNALAEFEVTRPDSTIETYPNSGYITVIIAAALA